MSLPRAERQVDVVNCMVSAILYSLKLLPEENTMTVPQDFTAVFALVSPEASALASQLRSTIQAALPEADENVSGGAKVQVVLYSIGGPNRVICGLQHSGPKCFLYLHRIQAEDVPEYPLQGKGKHAKRLNFTHDNPPDGQVITRLLKLSAARLED